MSSISLFFIAASMAALSGQPQGQAPPSAPPSTYENSQPHSAGPQSQPAPQAPAPQDQTEANRRIHDSISDLLSSDPVLSGSDVDATVDDHNITLTGKVQSYVQHQRVLQLVSSYGRWRKIVDKMEAK